VVDSDVSPPEPADGLITLYEAAERLGVHYMTVYRYVRTGRLPGRKVGVEWRVDPRDLAQVQPARKPATATGGRRTDASGTSEASAPAGRRRRVDYRRRLVDRLIAGDEHGSWAIVQNALAAGHDSEELYLDVLAPALETIGEEWAGGRLTVAEEHQASVVVQRLIGRLGPLFTRRGRTRGSVVIGAPPGDTHSLPSALFADLLRGAGFTAVDLGADTPAPSFVDTARRAERLVAVGISVTTPDRDAIVADLVADLRAAVSVPVVLGGGAVTSSEHAHALGADHWAGTTRDAVDLFGALADEAGRQRRRAPQEDAP